MVVADEATGVARQCSVRLRPALVIAALLLALPILAGLGIRWSARAETAALRATATTLQAENDSFREMTRALTDQLEGVQAAVAQLSIDSRLDPDSARALSRLPAAVRSGAMGGSSMTTPIARSVLAPTLASPDDTFGMLREVLGRLGSRLDLVRGDVQRRAALAASTPSIWPSQGNLSASYGRRVDPFNGELAHHSGIDISAPKGQPVYATAAGTVKSAGWNGDYGKMVVIDHGFGLVTRYGHLHDFTVKAGDEVERMQQVGVIGATGRATGPHLHYELLVNGQLTNPLSLLTGKRR
ncbi:MAG TPA: M23 family metallopeptidase [Vicinamibacterales bacterium]|nr:M23 family metallopeptidase [Vicinamibacterales bacterium]